MRLLLQSLIATATKQQQEHGSCLAGSTETFRSPDDLWRLVMHDRPNPASDMAASDMVKTRVLVVGAGPVGLTLAMDLATRGISVAVVETRAAGEPPSVKC